MQTIGDWAFNSCNNLGSVVIGRCVQTIGYAAFNACTSLKTVVIKSESVASGLDAQDSMGYFIYYAEEVYIKTGLEVGDYMSETNYPYIDEIPEDSDSENAGYTRYGKTEYAA